MNTHAARLGHLAPDQLQAALDRFGLGRLIATTPITTGNFGQNVFLTTTTGEYVFRGNPFFDWQFPKEQAAARILHERTDVPVPWPYHYEPSPELFGWPFVIMPRLPGRNLWDASESDHIASAGAMGGMLVRFQQATCETAMEFDLGAGKFVPLPDEERAWLSGHIQHNLQLSMAASGSTSESDAVWVGSLIAAAERSTIAWAPSCLVHGDFTINNVVAADSSTGWNITGVFDFMTARIGSLEADLCRQFALYHEGTTDAGVTFLESYFTLSPPRAGYRERVPLLLLEDRLTLWEWLQRTRPDWWTSDIGLRDWVEPVLDAMLRYG